MSYNPQGSLLINQDDSWKVRVFSCFFFRGSCELNPWPCDLLRVFETNPFGFVLTSWDIDQTLENMGYVLFVLK